MEIFYYWLCDSLCGPSLIIPLVLKFKHHLRCLKNIDPPYYEAIKNRLKKPFKSILHKILRDEEQKKGRGHIKVFLYKEDPYTTRVRKKVFFEVLFGGASLFKGVPVSKELVCHREVGFLLYQAWDALKGRFPPPPPPTATVKKGRTPHGSVYDKYLVNSKQRLRAALRNIRTIKELPSDDGYKITDPKLLTKNERREEKCTPQPSQSTGECTRPRRKAKVEPAMYTSTVAEDAGDPDYPSPSPRDQQKDFLEVLFGGASLFKGVPDLIAPDFW